MSRAQVKKVVMSHERKLDHSKTRHAFLEYDMVKMKDEGVYHVREAGTGYEEGDMAAKKTG